MEIAPEKVFLAQKMMIHKANLAGKPVITATQMMESMCSKPRPTRAECTDVANAVLDGTDCVMLSGETAGGDYPLNAVDIMGRVCCEAEGDINYDLLFQQTRNRVLKSGNDVSVPEAVASSAVNTAIQVGAKMLVVMTESGQTAKLIAKYRPACPILVLTPSQETARQIAGLTRGCECEVLGSMIGSESILIKAAEMGKDRGYVKAGDTIIGVHGIMEGQTFLKSLLLSKEADFSFVRLTGLK